MAPGPYDRHPLLNGFPFAVLRAEPTKQENRDVDCRNKVGKKTVLYSTKPCPNQSVSALPVGGEVTTMAFDDSTKMPPTGHHSRRDTFKSAPDEPQQGSAQPEFARHSTIERAVRRLGWTPQMPYKTPRALDDIVNEQRVRFGRRVGSTRLSLVSRLCLASVLVAVPAAGIFWFRHLAAEKAFTESTPSEEAPAEARERTWSTTAPTERPPATGVVQSAAPARPAPTAASAQAAPESEANLAFGSPPAVAPPGEPAPNTARTPAESTPGVASTAVVGALATPTGKPELNAATAPAAPTSTATSTVTTPRPPKPPAELGFSATEIAALLARGDWLLATGDVASARIFYERAAHSGEAQAAVRLGQTFDPVFLDRAHLRSVPSDLGMALFWYRLARDLGAAQVERRLKTLETKRGG